MYKINFLVVKLKKLFIPIFIYLFVISLLVFSNTNLSSAKTGLTLWANSVVPSLLPFFIATELLGYTNIIALLGKYFTKIMKPLFNVPGEACFPFIMGIISGYPIGAKIICNFKKQGICTTEECERLLAFTNNSGPLFIIGTVGIGLFKDIKIGFLLFFTHILSCITVGFLFRWWKNRKTRIKYSSSPPFASQTICISNLGEVLSISIMNSINTIFLIGGFIVLFSVIISILKNSGFFNIATLIMSPILNLLKIPIIFSEGIISGIVELTNGVCNIALITSASNSLNIILCAFLLGFGGFSIALQILSIISKSELSIKPYLIGKFLQGVLAAVYTYIII